MIAKKQIIYEICMAILALTAVILAVSDLFGKIPPQYYHTYTVVDSSILFLFLIDYVVRFTRAENKKVFFKDNVCELIALIPFNSLFRALRVVRLFRISRLFRLLRVAVFVQRFNKKSTIFLRTNGFIYIMYATMISILAGSTIMYLLPKEAAIKTYSDALWWAFVTATTVGYGDISPSTLPGRLVAAVLMIVGIGFISMLTGTIATYFLDKTKSAIEQTQTSDRTLDLSDLSDEEFEMVNKYIRFIKSEQKKSG